MTFLIAVPIVPPAPQPLPRPLVTPLEFAEPKLATPDLKITGLQLEFSSPEPILTKVSKEPPRLMGVANSLRPRSGGQMLYQRIAALEAGISYTRLGGDSFSGFWLTAPSWEPSYEQWQGLLVQEAKAMAYGQGPNPLAVVVGDSLSMWFPQELLPQKHLWLNQAISGENTGQILKRLQYGDFRATRPEKIYLMAGINDIRQGVKDETILANQRQIIRLLRRDFPRARTVLQSLLPTRFAAISDRRLRNLNQELAKIAAQEGAEFLNLYDLFLNNEGQLRRELTTDGLHLSADGYELWAWAWSMTS